MSRYDEWAKDRERLRAFIAAGPPARWNRPAMAINLRPPRDEKPWGFLNAVSRAFRRVRREVWTAREEALRGERWEGIG